MLSDVRDALRQLRKSPVFTLTTALILTLGIGINTAIFSIVHHVLLEPLPFVNPDQLYAVWARSDAQGDARIAASGPDFVDYQEQSKLFSQIAVMLDFTETWTGVIGGYCSTGRLIMHTAPAMQRMIDMTAAKSSRDGLRDV